METTRNLDFEKVPQVCVELEIAINPISSTRPICVTKTTTRPASLH